MRDILVLGGSNVDYLAISTNPLILKDSNIGKLVVSFGGVGRNIVENLARMGERVSFITVLGHDYSVMPLKRELKDLGVKIYSPDLDGQTSSYLAVMDNDGSLREAVCDSNLMDGITYQNMIQFRDIINKHHDIVMDANWPEDVIDQMFKNYFSHDFFVEAVSVKKVLRFRNHLSEISLFKGNLFETRSLLNMDKDARSLAQTLLDRGVKKAVITDGRNPIIFADSKTGQISECKAIPCDNIVSVNGAGDAMFAGLIYGLRNLRTFADAVSLGNKMANKALLCHQAVNPDVKSVLNQD